MSCELNAEPFDVVKEVYQLDKKLIKEINNSEGYRFSGTCTDYGYKNKNEKILSNTVILENYVNKVKPRTDKKLRIFIRGGSLVNFIAGTNLRIPISTLDFDYDEQENILRFVLNKNHFITTEPEWTMIGEHRLTGDKSENINFGMNNIYRVMELCTEDYELFYSKEFDGFDGNEPIEIRGVQNIWGLNSLKIQYRSAALADIKKVVIMITDRTHLLQRVTIVDDFTKHDQNPGVLRRNFYQEINVFFQDYIPILKEFKKGRISKTSGGIIIEPEELSVSNNKNISIITCGIDDQLRRLLNLNRRSGKIIEYGDKNPNDKLFLCANNPKLVQELIEEEEVGNILGCFIQHKNLQAQEERKTDYFPAVYYWRKIIHSINPDLLRPMPLLDQISCTFWPFFISPPFLPGHIVSNNSFWRLSYRNNLIFAEKRKDLKELLEHLALPLPHFTGRIHMTVYTQDDCKDILMRYFGNLICFNENNDVPIICEIKIIPKEHYRSTVLDIMNGNEYLKPPRKQKADLYLIGSDSLMEGKWDNKFDLQLLEEFKGLDPIRKYPNRIALFSEEPEDHRKVIEILKKSHFVDYDSDILIFESIEEY